MADRWVTSSELDALRQSDTRYLAWRFDDANDDARHTFMYCVRKFANATAAQTFCQRSMGTNYMGRKRRVWHAMEYKPLARAQ